MLCITISMDAQSKWQLIPHLGGNVTKLFGHEKAGEGKWMDRLNTLTLSIGIPIEL